MLALKNFFKSSHFLTITLFVGLVLIFFTYLPEPGGEPQLRSAKASIPSLDTSALTSVAEASGAIRPEEYTEIHGIIRPGDSLDLSFGEHDVPPAIRSQFYQAYKDFLDFGRIHPGEQYSIFLNSGGEIVKSVYQVNPFTSYTALSSDSGLQVKRDEVDLEVRTLLLKGQITTSLFAAFPDDLQNPKPIFAFADIFASRLDFNTETRVGDLFSLIVEEYYRAGEFIGYGPILAARYEKNAGESLQAYRFSPDGKKFSYFDPEGHELGASFIRSPVAMGRVSSRFSQRRLHPILGVVRQHLGVDLAAPVGTPIMAAADGRVVSIGNNGGFGKQIVLAHGGDYRTYYGHLSRFKNGLKVGSQVKQKQVIGYVGATGLATGPHLDYRLQHHGIYKNPFALKFQPKSTLSGDALLALNESLTPLKKELSTAGSEQILESKSLTLSDGQQPALL